MKMTTNSSVVASSLSLAAKIKYTQHIFTCINKSWTQQYRKQLVLLTSNKLIIALSHPCLCSFGWRLRIEPLEVNIRSRHVVFMPCKYLSTVLDQNQLCLFSSHCISWIQRSSSSKYTTLTWTIRVPQDTLNIIYLIELLIDKWQSDYFSSLNHGSGHLSPG